MPWWWVVIDLLAVIVVLVMACLLLLVARRHFLSRRGSSFELCVNRRSGPTVIGWRLGLAVYSIDTLDWYRMFSVRLRPAYRFVRGEVQVDGRRMPQGSESDVLHAGNVIVATENATEVRQFSMSPQALTGMLAWMESAPPGRSVKPVL